MRRHGVAEQAIAARPCARDGDFGNRRGGFRGRKGCSDTPQVYWSAESAWYALRLRRGSPMLLSAGPDRHPPAECDRMGEILTVFILMLDVPLT